MRQEMRVDTGPILGEEYFLPTSIIVSNWAFTTCKSYYITDSSFTELFSTGLSTP